MKKLNLKRSSYLFASDLALTKRPIKLWGYDKSENFVCRLEISAAGIAIFSGRKGGRKLGRFNWEGLVKKLSE